MLAFGLLIFYHIGMYYVSDWGWHIKSQHQSEWHVTWNHLWFLMYIYAYSVAAWAVSLLFKLLNLAGFWPLIEKRVGPVLMILGLPIALLSLNGQLLYERYPPSNDFINDYFNHGRYFMAFVMGVVFVQAPRYWRAVRQWRKPMLAAALVSFAIALFLFPGGELGGEGFAQALEDLCWSGNGWLWMLAICGWSQYLLNKNNAVIRYLNGGVYCYYILHQTVIIALAHQLSPLELGPVLEPICLVVLTLLACLGGYEVLRCIPDLRMCFGITASRNPGLSSEEISSLPSTCRYGLIAREEIFFAPMN